MAEVVERVSDFLKILVDELTGKPPPDRPVDVPNHNHGCTNQNHTRTHRRKQMSDSIQHRNGRTTVTEATLRLDGEKLLLKS